MRTKITLFLILAAISVIGTACGSTPAINSTTANNAAANSTDPLAVKTVAPEATVNDAPTLKPVFQAWCDAKKKGSEAELRKLYSQDSLETFEVQMKEDGIKGLVKFLEDDKVSKTCEIRNEQITGDKAVAEIVFDSAPRGVKIIFLKEKGEWKVTNQAPTLESVKASNSATNTAK